MGEKFDISKGLAEREVIVARSQGNIKKFGSTGSAFIGRILSLDGSFGSKIRIDFSTSHCYLICGKRGYGKSYTMGTIIEEYSSMPEETRNEMSVVIYDTMGIFWTFKYPNLKETALLEKWNEKAKEIKVRVLIPKGVEEKYISRKIPYDGIISIKPRELEITDWIELFGLNFSDPMAAFISDSIRYVEDKKKGDYSLEDIKKAITESEVDDELKDTAGNLFTFAQSWGLFDPDGLEPGDIAKKGAITVLDVSSLPHSGGFSVKSLVLAVIGRKIYEARVLSRKAEELSELAQFGRVPEIKEAPEEIPITWLFIDEAHMFVPAHKRTIATDVILDEWIRQGRQPGLGLVLATQRPAALDSTVISQSDVIISMRLTAQEDIEALSKVRPSYMKDDFGSTIKRMGKEKGRALIIDDTSESHYIIQIKPRVSWHGGEESRALH
jgi:DNA helicase HerA-like ATPase